MAVIALLVILVVGLVAWTTFRPAATAAPTL
jgi:hypothetical protein